MSVKAMSQVWDLELSHNKLLVLLAMTDHADHEGKNIYPSVGLIAWKTGYSKRQVQRIIDELEIDGLLVLVQERAGSTKKYRFDASKGAKKTEYKPTHDKMSPHDIAVSSLPMTSDVIPTHDIAVSSKPSIEPSIEPIAPKVAKSKTKPYYDAIVDILNIHGGQNADMQKMLLGVSKKNGYQEYNLSPAMELSEFQEWGAWAKKEHGQYMVKAAAKVNGSITKFRLQKQYQLENKHHVTGMNASEAAQQAMAAELRGLNNGSK